MADGAPRVVPGTQRRAAGVDESLRRLCGRSLSTQPIGHADARAPIEQPGGGGECDMSRDAAALPAEDHG